MSLDRFIRPGQVSVAIGSCMSNLVASMLHSYFGVERIFNVAHNRIDYFLNTHLWHRWAPPPFDHVVGLIGPEDPGGLVQIVRNQYREDLGLHEITPTEDPYRRDMLGYLTNRPVDFILCDNFMDQVGRLARARAAGHPWGSSQLFMVDSLVKDPQQFQAEFELTDYVDPALAARLWGEWLHYLRMLQPAATICFMGFPYTIDRTAPEKAARSHLMENLIRQATAELDIIFLPALNVPADHSQFPRDKLHFEGAIYKGIAGMLYSLRMGGVRKLLIANQ